MLETLRQAFGIIRKDLVKTNFKGDFASFRPKVVKILDFEYFFVTRNQFNFLKIKIGLYH